MKETEPASLDKLCKYYKRFMCYGSFYNNSRILADLRVAYSASKELFALLIKQDLITPKLRQAILNDLLLRAVQECSGVLELTYLLDLGADAREVIFADEFDSLPDDCQSLLHGAAHYDESEPLRAWLSAAVRGGFRRFGDSRKK